MIRTLIQKRQWASVSGTIFMAALLAVSLGMPSVQNAFAASKRSSSASGHVALVSFSPFPPIIHPIRIGLASHAPLARFAVWEQGAVFVDGQAKFEILPGQVYSISNGAIHELATGRCFQMPRDRRIHVSARDYRVWTGNRWYRGCLELINFGNSVTVINLLDLEEYLLGVVPSEMPSSWNLEALKAQAVAARSYAWAHHGDHSKWTSEGYDLVPDVRDQAYKGLGAEAKSTFMAVAQTRGLILKDSGKVKAGFYRAWVGDDVYENLNIRKSAVPSSTLERMTGVPKIVGVTVKQWDATGNAQALEVMGSKKTREVYGVALAKMLGFSTAGILDVNEQGPNWVFTYRGPGNGARGLSQNGANMLASRGWRFDQILQQYYQDPDGKLRLDYIDGFRAPATTALAPKATKLKKSAESDSSSDESDSESK